MGEEVPLHPPVFITHIHLYPLVTVTLFPLFLNDSMRLMNLLYAMSLFIMEIIDCSGRNLSKLEHIVSFNRSSRKSI